MVMLNRGQGPWRHLEQRGGAQPLHEVVLGPRRDGDVWARGPHGSRSGSCRLCFGNVRDPARRGDGLMWVAVDVEGGGPCSQKGSAGLICESFRMVPSVRLKAVSVSAEWTQRTCRPRRWLGRWWSHAGQGKCVDSACRAGSLLAGGTPSKWHRGHWSPAAKRLWK